MTEAKRATIRALLMVSYSEILIQARRGVKGLRTAHLFSIQLLGEYPEGLRLMEICKLSGKAKGNISERLKRCQRAGFIYSHKINQSNVRWKLTEQGQQVYNTIVKESDKAIKEITVLLAAEVRKKLE